MAECEKGQVTLRLRSEVIAVSRDEAGYRVQLNGAEAQAEKLVIASGGLSMPGRAPRRSAIGWRSSSACVSTRRALRWCLYPAQATAGAVTNPVGRIAADGD